MGPGENSVIISVSVDSRSASSRQQQIVGHSNRGSARLSTLNAPAIARFCDRPGAIPREHMDHANGMQGVAQITVWEKA